MICHRGCWSRWRFKPTPLASFDGALNVRFHVGSNAFTQQLLPEEQHSMGKPHLASLGNVPTCRPAVMFRSTAVDVIALQSDRESDIDRIVLCRDAAQRSSTLRMDENAPSLRSRASAGTEHARDCAE
jgi:hypothetical protein